jgi:hypothetical protein
VFNLTRGPGVGKLPRPVFVHSVALLDRMNPRDLVQRALAPLPPGVGDDGLVDRDVMNEVEEHVLRAMDVCFANEKEVVECMLRRGYSKAGQTGKAWLWTSLRSALRMAPIAEVRVVSNLVLADGGEWAVVPKNLNKGVRSSSKQFLAYRRCRDESEAPLRACRLVEQGDIRAQGELQRLGFTKAGELVVPSSRWSGATSCGATVWVVQ